jgi:predicted metal-dependent phosphoesterase TrpH
MYPRALVRRAFEQGLDMIAVCDHNSSENTEFVIRAASGYGIKVLPGMEITSSEEVHITALFESTDNLYKIQHLVYDSLSGSNREEIFGCQAIVNDLDEVEGFNEKLLIGATSRPLEDWVKDVHDLGGLAIASHIDREAFSIIGQLGFIPPDLRLDALEVSARTGITEARREFAELYRMPFITSSDAHFIKDIGKAYTIIRMSDANLGELKMALAGVEGRMVVGQGAGIIASHT